MENSPYENRAISLIEAMSIYADNPEELYKSTFVPLYEVLLDLLKDWDLELMEKWQKSIGRIEPKKEEEAEEE